MVIVLLLVTIYPFLCSNSQNSLQGWLYSDSQPVPIHAHIKENDFIRMLKENKNNSEILHQISHIHQPIVSGKLMQ